MIGIQNNAKKSKLLFFNMESVRLPIAFIVGTSFIGGSILGSILVELKEK